MKVIKIGAVWCSGCLVMRPRWEEIEKENLWLVTENLDFDENSEKVKIYGLDESSLPTFVFLDKKGWELERLTGEISKEKLLKVIEKYRDK